MSFVRYEVYTDGSNLSKKYEGKELGAGCGVIVLGVTHSGVFVQTSAFGEFIGEASNSVAELKAVKFGIEEVKGKNEHIDLFTDAQYCVNLFSRMEMWGWKNEPRVHVDLVNEIREMIEKLKSFDIKWVKGHSKNQWNESAHKFASMARTLKERVEYE